MHDGTPDGIWNSQDHPSGLPDSGPVSSAGTGAESATARQDARKIRENVAHELAAANDQLMAKNHALAQALSRAGKELTKAKAQLSQMAQPPKTFATMVKVDSSMTDELGVQHASAEILTGGRRLVVPVAANVNASRLTAGACVLLNENMVLVEQRGTDMLGSVRTIRQVFDDGRLIVADGGGNPSVIRRSGALAHETFANGQRVIVDPSGRLALELLPDENDADLVLEEVPDVTFADIGGLDSQIASGTPCSCRSFTAACTNGTISRRPRACCCTALPATARP